MSALNDAYLHLRILGCADGPASFNAESTRRGTEVISTDPLYRFDAGTIRDRIAATYEQMLEQTRQNSQQFVWVYTEHLSEAFHRSAILESCRVARQVRRIFPL